MGVAVRVMLSLPSGSVPTSPQRCPLILAHPRLGLRGWAKETVLGWWRGWGWWWLCGVEMPCSWPLSGLPLGCGSGSSALFVGSQQLAGWSWVFAKAAQSVPEASSKCCCGAGGGCTPGGAGWRWTPDRPSPGCGCFSITCVHEAHVDQKNKVVTTPAFMCDTALHHIHDGIGAMVRKVLELAGR